MFTLIPTSFKSTQEALDNLNAIITTPLSTTFPLQGCGRDITQNLDLANLFDTVFGVKWCEDYVECHMPSPDKGMALVHLNRLCSLISNIEKTESRSHDELVASKMIFLGISMAIGKFKKEDELEGCFTYFEERVMNDRVTRPDVEAFNRSDVVLSIAGTPFIALTDITIDAAKSIGDDTHLELLYKNRCVFLGSYKELKALKDTVVNAAILDAIYIFSMIQEAA